MGKRFVVDITIDDTNHYITESGLVNKNCWDEITHFTRKQVMYMFSRGRNARGNVRPYVRGTCNPVPPEDPTGGWVHEFVSWYINPDTGYAIPERSGVIRWFVNRNSELHWSNDREELAARFPGLTPKSFTFVHSDINDNQILLQNDPDYLANLQALDLIEQERLLRGNWLIKPSAGKVFNENWFEVVDAVPAGGHVVRFWDLAATEKELAKDDPDYTASCLMKVVDDVYYVLEATAEQMGPARTDRALYNTATQDGRDLPVRWEREGGASGKRDNRAIATMLDGWDAKGIKPQGDKLVRAKGLAAQAYAGNVKLLRGAWNKRWLTHMHGQPDLAHDDECILPDTLLPSIRHDDIISPYKYHHVGKGGNMSVVSANHLTVGDLVMTHTGNWEPVARVMVRTYDGEVVTIKPQGGLPMTMTPEHPVLCVRNERNHWSSRPPRAEGAPEWVLAGDVQVNDSVIESIDTVVAEVDSIDLVDFMKKDTIESEGKPSKAKLDLSKVIIDDEFIKFNNPRSRPVKRHLKVDADLMRLMGYYIAEGAQGRHFISVAFALHETDYADDVVSLMESIFGVSPYVKHERNYIRIQLSSLVIRDFFSQFGSKANNKRIPEWIMHLPTNLQAEFFKGAWRGDGCTTRYGFAYTTASVDLMKGMQMMLYRAGIVPGLSVSRKNGKEHEINGVKTKSGALYNLRIGGGYAIMLEGILKTGEIGDYVSDKIHDRIIGGYVRRRVKGVEISDYTGDVYNYEVANDHSYQTISFCVHNCDAASGAYNELQRLKKSWGAGSTQG